VLAQEALMFLSIFTLVLMAILALMSFPADAERAAAARRQVNHANVMGR